MPDAEIIALLDHIKDIGERTEEKLDQHIERDERNNAKFLLPLWEESQQRKGAAKLAVALYTIVGGLVVGVLDLFLKAPR